MPAHYDDPKFSYLDYWQSRDYEHQSEVLALNHLLKKLHFTVAADIGGGYGRLIPTIGKFTKKIIMVEPSSKQRKIAQKKFIQTKSVSIISGTAEKTKLSDKSIHLVTLIRVMHHLPNPQKTFDELFRILKPGGFLVLEFANSKHFKAQIQSYITGKPILPIPIEKRSLSNIKKNTISFVNHHPITIMKLLKRVGFKIEKTLSVSNLRSPTLKKIIPLSVLINLEKSLQAPLGKWYFGPSIFVLASKPKSSLTKD